MTLLCRYRDLFGQPGSGVHSYRLGPFAAVDLLLTLVAGFLLSYALDWSLWVSTSALFVLGIFMHWLFCVDTAFMTLFLP